MTRPKPQPMKPPRKQLPKQKAIRSVLNRAWQKSRLALAAPVALLLVMSHPGFFQNPPKPARPPHPVVKEEFLCGRRSRPHKNSSFTTGWGGFAQLLESWG